MAPPRRTAMRECNIAGIMAYLDGLLHGTLLLLFVWVCTELWDRRLRRSDRRQAVDRAVHAPEETSWVKIKNPAYSQAEGRRELFEKRVRAASA